RRRVRANLADQAVGDDAAFGVADDEMGLGCGRAVQPLLELPPVMLWWATMARHIAPEIGVTASGRTLDFQHRPAVEGEPVEAGADASSSNHLRFEHLAEPAFDEGSGGRLQRQA